MNASLLSTPAVQLDAEWRAAAQRVECCLRAHRVGGARRLAQLTADVIGVARATQRPGTDVLTAAMETLDSCLAAWFARVLPEADARDAGLPARGRLALAMSEAPTPWPDHFLSQTGLPAAMTEAIRSADLGRGPDVYLSHMVPNLEDRAVPAVKPNWRTPYRWAFLRILTGTAMVISLIGAAIAAAR